MYSVVTSPVINRLHVLGPKLRECKSRKDLTVEHEAAIQDEIFQLDFGTRNHGYYESEIDRIMKAFEVAPDIQLYFFEKFLVRLTASLAEISRLNPMPYSPEAVKLGRVNNTKTAVEKALKTLRPS